MSKKQQGQSFLDLVIQQSGSFSEVINAAIYNNASLTDSLKIGDNVDNETVIDKNNVEMFKQQHPATEIKISSESNEIGEGIGYWGIKETFIIS